MTKAWKRYAFGMATGLALLMHLLLFVAVRPADGSRSTIEVVPPQTYYLAAPSNFPLKAGGRIAWSPVLFSLPSPLGFSRELMDEKLKTRLTFAQPERAETFLPIDPSARAARSSFQPAALMLTAGNATAPSPPATIFSPITTKPDAPRVHVAPALKERLEGGVVLPPTLNRVADPIWEVRAEVRVSQQGIIEHVFLEQPLETPALNQAVIQLLHGLRFRSGEHPVEGYIEIYSVAPDEGIQP